MLFVVQVRPMSVELRIALAPAPAVRYSPAAR
jgi:hypothetical protein